MKDFKEHIPALKKRFFVFIKIFIFLLWDLSGLRFIWYKIMPKYNKDPNNPPATIMIWIFGVYTALWGIASQRYENRVDVIESRANYTIAQLSTPYYKDALNRLSSIQNMTCPVLPEISDPSSIIRSIIGKSQKYDQMVVLIKETIMQHKDKLDSVNLSGINLSGIDLSRVSFIKSNLKNSNLSFCDLKNANFNGAEILKTNFNGADLRYADLRFQRIIDNQEVYKDFAETLILDDQIISLLKAKTLQGTKLPNFPIDLQKYFPVLFDSLTTRVKEVDDIRFEWVEIEAKPITDLQFEVYKFRENNFVDK